MLLSSMCELSSLIDFFDFCKPTKIVQHYNSAIDSMLLSSVDSVTTRDSPNYLE